MSSETTSTRLDQTAVVQRLDQGHESLAWQHHHTLRDVIRVDLGALLSSKNPEKAVQLTPAQQMFWAIKEQGVEQCYEVIRLLSDDQLTRILDYDGWRHDELAPTQAIQWLNAFETHGENSVATRYRRLDEEFQIALLQGKIRTYDSEEIDMLPDSLRDQLIPMPGGELYYEVLSDDEDFVAFVVRLVDSALELDSGYAFGILSYAAYSVPNEAEYQLLQFREARMQEDGFVGFDESQECFRPLNFEALKKKWTPPMTAGQSQGLRTSGFSEISFLEQVLRSDLATTKHLDVCERIHDGLLFLANSLRSAVGIEPGDSRGLVKVLEQERALVSLGLEFLAERNVEHGFKILSDESPKNLFRVGLTLITLIQNKVIDLMRDRVPGLDGFEDLHRRRKIGAMLFYLDTKLLPVLGFELNEMLKGLFNRFPMRLASVASGDTTRPTRYQFRTFIDLDDLNEFNVELSQVIESVIQKH